MILLASQARFSCKVLMNINEYKRETSVNSNAFLTILTSYIILTLFTAHKYSFFTLYFPHYLLSSLFAYKYVYFINMSIL